MNQETLGPKEEATGPEDTSPRRPSEEEKLCREPSGHLGTSGPCAVALSGDGPLWTAELGSKVMITQVGNRSCVIPAIAPTTQG